MDAAALLALAQDTTHDARDEAALHRAYPAAPGEAARLKVADHIHPLYRPYIEASPFVVLATCGEQGAEASPRGDAPGFVRVLDEHTLVLPERRGNQRIDSLRNLVRDPRAALLFLIPGSRETLRVQGSARISTSPALCAEFAVGGRAPASVLVITVTRVFFQCGRALARSALWDASRQVAPGVLPSVGTILQALSNERIDGAAYDAELPARQADSLY